MVYTLIFEQHHDDPAPMLAVHHVIKSCIEQGLHVVCGYEATEPFDQLIADTERENPSANMAAQLFLYRYLKSQSIKAVPIDSEKLVIQMSEEFAALSKKLQEDVRQANARGQYQQAQKIDAESDDQLRKLMNGYELPRINYMLEVVQKLAQETQTEGKENTIIVLFNVGNIHAERLAKHATIQGINATAIICSTHPDFATEDTKQATAKRSFVLAQSSAQVDNDEINKMTVPLVELILRYDPRTTRLATLQGKVTNIQLGEFADRAQLTPLLDSVIPVKLALPQAIATEEARQIIIKHGGRVTSEGDQAIIQLPMPRFDKALKDALQLKKVRVKGLTEMALTVLKAYGVAIAADREPNAHLLMFSAAQDKEIQKICRNGLVESTIPVFIFGQNHWDSAPILAAHHMIKHCIERGLRVVCGYEGHRQADAFMDMLENNLVREEPEISPSTADYLFLHRYLKSQSIKIMPIRSKEIDTQLQKALDNRHIEMQNEIAQEVLRGNIKRATDIADSETNEKHKVMNSFEPKLVDYMVDSLSELYQDALVHDKGNTVIFLLNVGAKHAERMAKYAAIRGIKATAIICSPNMDLASKPLRESSSLQETVLSQCVAQTDSDAIRKLQVDVVKLVLHYNQTATKIVISHGKVTDIQPGEFADRVQLTPLLDSVIPVKLALPQAIATEEARQMIIKQGGQVTSEGDQAFIQLPMPRFDKALKDALQLKKVRVKRLTEIALTALKERGVAIAADHEANAHLLLFSAAQDKEIDEICRTGRTFVANTTRGKIGINR